MCIKRDRGCVSKKLFFVLTKFVTYLVVVSLPVAVTLVVGHRDSLQPLHVPHLQRKYLPPYDHFIQGCFSSFYLLMTHPDHSGHHNADGEPVVARQRLPVHLVGQEDVAPGVDRSAGWNNAS